MTSTSCAQQTCDAHASCDDTSGTALCSCSVGYKGNGTSCTDINECSGPTPPSCDAHASCVNTPGSAHCECDQASGYSGDGMTCSQGSACPGGQGDCDAVATCTTVSTDKLCVCPSGYSGNGGKAGVSGGTGTGCANINECATNNGGCAANAVCTDKTPGFTCACPAGFTGDGYTHCDNINECTAGTATCPANEICTDTVPGYTCGCNAPTYVQTSSACYCNMDGFWGMRQAVTISWSDVVQYSDLVLSGGEYKTTVWELHRMRYDGTTVTVDKKGCGSAGTPDLYSPFFKETYSSYVPKAVWDAFDLFAGVNLPLSSAKPGSKFPDVRTDEAAVVGIKLANPLTDPWPATHTAAGIVWDDADGDGMPGLMFWPRTPAETTQGVTLNSSYSYLPVATVGKRATCVSTASRSINYLDGQLDTCDQITGKVFNVKADTRVSDCRRAPATASGCTKQNCCTKANWPTLPACLLADVNGLDDQNAHPTSTADFQLKRLSADPNATDITCDTVRQALP